MKLSDREILALGAYVTRTETNHQLGITGARKTFLSLVWSESLAERQLLPSRG
jgi:hypothetical protein